MKDLLRGHSKLNHKTMILVKTKRKTRKTTSEAITKRIRKELIHIAFITKKKSSSTKVLVETRCQVQQLWSIRPYGEAATADQ